MQQIKKTADHTIYQKKSGRYAVQGKDKRWVNGDEKSGILLAEGLISPPKTKAPPAPEIPESAPDSEPAAENAQPET
jgi:hypothetical protein